MYYFFTWDAFSPDTFLVRIELVLSQLNTFNNIPKDVEKLKTFNLKRVRRAKSQKGSTKIDISIKIKKINIFCI